MRVPAIARPLNTDPPAELSTRTAPDVPSEPCQPMIVPSSVAKRKRSFKKVPEPPLNTVPVGVDWVPTGDPGAGGMVTTSPCFVPSPAYNVARPAALSAIQNGVVGPNEMPQGLRRSGSIMLAGTAPSDTRLVWK